NRPFPGTTIGRRGTPASPTRPAGILPGTPESLHLNRTNPNSSDPPDRHFAGTGRTRALWSLQKNGPRPGRMGGRAIFVRGEGTGMSTPAEVRLARRVLRHELEAIRGNWGWILALGIVLVVVGTLAIAMPFAGSLASVIALSVLMIVGGVVQLVGAFWTRD